MSINRGRAVVAGVVGSLAFSAVGLWLTPLLLMAVVRLKTVRE